MPDITTVGTFTAETPGFLFLKQEKRSIGLIFSGSTLPTTLEVGVLNDNDVFVPLTNGTVTTLPTSFIVDSVPDSGLIIQVTGGTPNFNVSKSGLSSEFK